ncbi:MAG TPA: GlsB/YeaQ/YmgE family stress response membrane protein [Xanthobacteraceae bacterium]
MPMSGQSLIVILLVGLIAGWLAAKIVTGGGLGIIGDLVVGILGAFLAAWLLPKLGVRLGTGIVRQIIDATLGAVILLALVRLVRRL